VLEATLRRRHKGRKIVPNPCPSTQYQSFVVPLVFLLSWLASAGAGLAHDVPAEMAEAAGRLLKSLDEPQLAQVSIEFGKEKRTAWHYIPSSMMESRGGRRGLAIKEMSAEQRVLSHGLLSTALSHRGYFEAMTIMALEAILHDLENGNPARDPTMYHVAIYGEPSVEETWGWSVEGHHLSVNLTLVDGQRFCTTPSFFGSNPAIVREGPFQGLDTLEAEQKLARQLVRSLTPEQKKLGVISEKAPRDIVTAADREVTKDQFQPPQGIAFEKLNEPQQKMLLGLIGAFTAKYRPEILEQIDERTPIANREGMFFAWAGGVEPGQGHYYRIQTPKFLFEYDNVQGKANHIHTVWREFDGDFGVDLLRRHYETSGHHAR
jgi:Protein of unknown function (DUF3500)